MKLCGNPSGQALTWSSRSPTSGGNRRSQAARLSVSWSSVRAPELGWIQV
ncbi:hypothetical protein ACFYUV_50190 [Nonomuraea sp. NPDC003560]